MTNNEKIPAQGGEMPPVERAAITGSGGIDTVRGVKPAGNAAQGRNTTAPALDRDIAHLIDCSEGGIARVPRETLVRLRALLTSPRAAVPAPDLYWFGDHEHGFECPDDAAIVHGRKLGERFTLKASWYADMLFEVTKVPDDNDDDYEVREVDAAPAAPVTPSAEAEPIDKLEPTLILTGAQLLEALDLVAPDRTADQFESEVSFQYGNGHSGKGMYCWITDYPDEGASLLDGSTVLAQAVAADGAKSKDVVTREQVEAWAQQAEIETGWLTERFIAALGDFAIFARAAVSPATADGLPAWFDMFLTNVCEIPDRNSPEGEPDAIVATLDELKSCAISAIEECSPAPAPADERAAPMSSDIRAYLENLAKAGSEPLNSAVAYKDKASRMHFMVEVRNGARALLARASQAAAPAEAREHDDPEIIAASNRGYAAGLRDGKALGACGPLTADAGKPFQSRVQPWMLECFGPTIAADRIERNHRFLEEALELVQSLGCTASEAHQLVDYTFGRPIGKPMQEVGGVMVTLAALCLASELDMHQAGETELARISEPAIMLKIRAKQAAKPKHSPLPEAPAPGIASAAAFLHEVAVQIPEKPDHWSPCGQCQRNAERAQDLLDAACAQSIDLPDSEGGEA